MDALIYPAVNQDRLAADFRSKGFRSAEIPGIQSRRCMIACGPAIKAPGSARHVSCKSKQIELIVISEVTLVIKEKHLLVSFL
jgi:hypothetical protein